MTQTTYRGSRNLTFSDAVGTTHCVSAYRPNGDILYYRDLGVWERRMKDTESIHVRTRSYSTKGLCGSDRAVCEARMKDGTIIASWWKDEDELWRWLARRSTLPFREVEWNGQNFYLTPLLANPPRPHRRKGG